MSEYVVDAAAVVDALGRKDAVGIALRTRIAGATCHAPHLIDAEVGNVLRRSVRRGELREETARTALRALPDIIDHRYSHTGRLSDEAWKLRHTITFYDGLYVALAAMLDVPLLTCDMRLTTAPSLTCRIELIN